MFTTHAIQQTRKGCLALFFFLIWALAACSQPQVPEPQVSADQAGIPPAPDRTQVSTLAPVLPLLDLGMDEVLAYLPVLRSAAYPLESLPGGQATLIEGEYRAPASPGSAMELIVRLVDASVGDLDGNGGADAAVLLSLDLGGTLTQYYLYPVLLAGGQAEVLAPALAGERMYPAGVRVNGNRIEVRMVPPFEPGQPPQFIVHGYTLDGKSLLGPDKTESIADAPSSKLTVPTWLWQGISGAYNVSIDEPDQYTLRFSADGTYQVRAYANTGSGIYTILGSTIRLFPGKMTEFSCSNPILTAHFEDSLSEASTFAIQDGRLILQTRLDGGRMEFQASVR